jgi:high-affinity Fe2+/Pb2+ permease
MVEENMEQNEPNQKAKTLLIGAVVGALVGVSAAYLLIQRAEKENGNLQIGTGEGIKLGLLVLGLLRQVAQLGEG